MSVLVLDTDLASLSIKGRLSRAMEARLASSDLVAVSFATVGELIQWTEMYDWAPNRVGRAARAGRASRCGGADSGPAAGPRSPGQHRRRARVVATSSLLLWQVLTDAYSRLGFDALADEAFRAMALARIVEPTSKADSLRVLTEIGAPSPSLSTLFRSLKRCKAADYRDQLARACTEHSAAIGALAGLVLYDCTTLLFETGDEDGGAGRPAGPRKVGMSKERRVDPQVQVGLLVDPSGFPLEVHLFDGNTAGTTTILPVLRGFQQRHGVTGMVVVADAGLSRSAASPMGLRGEALARRGATDVADRPAAGRAARCSGHAWACEPVASAAAA